jgi:hypothetical protein
MAEQASLVSRRNMLLGLAGGAVVAGGVTVQQTGGAAQFAELLNPTGQSGRRGVNLATAEKEDWALQVGTFFTSETGQALKLVNVKAFPQRGARPSGLRKTAFVAAFDVASGEALVSDVIHTVNHNEGGAFGMFLTSGNRVNPTRMLAVFN